jgi:serpin B
MNQQPLQLSNQKATGFSSSLISPGSANSLSYVNTVNTFGLNILSHSLTLNPIKSTGLCAMNIYHCLSMVAAGSKDGNLAAFAKVLGFTPDLMEAMVNNTLALDNYTKSSSAVDLSSAAAIFPRKDFILEIPWKEVIQTKYEAEIGPLELEPINRFIERETRGKLKDVIKPNDLNGTLLMLVSCLYFKAKWAVSFDKQRTMTNVTFHGFEKDQTCALMYKRDKMEYVEDAKSQVVVLPYKSAAQGPKWKAAIILPKQRGVEAMRSLLTSLTSSPDALHNLLIGSSDQSTSSDPVYGSAQGRAFNAARGCSETVCLFLPRFSLRLNLDLIPSLSNLGLDPAFAPSNDFEPISKGGQLLISRATHDLFIEVTEEGTEMAAATVVSAT